MGFIIDFAIVAQTSIVSVISAAHRTGIVSMSVNVLTSVVATCDQDAFVHYWSAKVGTNNVARRPCM